MVRLKNPSRGTTAPLSIATLIQASGLCAIAKSTIIYALLCLLRHILFFL